ncbi:hypothetical protein [Spirosoma luteum]|uniref:hypothetical protein n=1 Tax=Spirosoma luteum TaxID=431553 RepID=UPI00036DB035|nr:hypothetical protein [Spirosoma luteum]
MVFEWVKGGQGIVFDQFRRQHPNWSVDALKVGVFERKGRKEFTTEETNPVKASFLEGYNRK